MPSDEELRRVAEDMRALARSLARDVRQAADAARHDGFGAREAINSAIRDVAEQTRRNLGHSIGNHGWRGYGPGSRTRPDGGGQAAPEGEPPMPPHLRSGPPGWQRSGGRRRGPWMGGPWTGGSWGGGPWTGGPWTGKPWPGKPWPGRPGPGGASAGPPGPDGQPVGAPGDGRPSVAGSRERAVWPGRNGPGPDGSPPGYPAVHRSDRRHRRRGLPPVRRRWDTTALLGLMVVMFGTAWLLGGLGVVHTSVEAVVAVGLMVVGAVCVLTARTDWSLSRHSWPVWVGAGMIVALLATSSTFGVPSAFRNLAVGDKMAVLSAKGPRTVYGGFGDLDVYLQSGAIGPVRVEGLAGKTTVHVCPGAAAQVAARVDAGQISTGGNRPVSEGLDNTWPGRVSTPDSMDPRPEVTDVTVHQMFGVVSVVSDNHCPPTPPTPVSPPSTGAAPQPPEPPAAGHS